MGYLPKDREVDENLQMLSACYQNKITILIVSMILMKRKVCKIFDNKRLLLLESILSGFKRITIIYVNRINMD